MADNINFMATEEQQINTSDNDFKKEIKAMLDNMSKDLKDTIMDVTREALTIINNTDSSNSEESEYSFYHLKERIDELETNVISNFRIELYERNLHISKDSNNIITFFADIKNQGQSHQETNGTSELSVQA